MKVTLIILLFFFTIQSIGKQATSGNLIVQIKDKDYNFDILYKTNISKEKRALFGDDINSALPNIKKIANQGSSQAQYKMGIAYFFGWGVPTNYKISQTYFKLAAKQNHLRAQRLLGHLYKVNMING